MHVFGNPCDVKAIDEIAQKNNLKVIAIHVGAKLDDISLPSFGDISYKSTYKNLSSIEGGAIITTKTISQKLEKL